MNPVGTASMTQWMQQRTQTQTQQRALTTIGWEDALAGKEGDIIVPQNEEDRQKMNEWFADYMERNPAPEYAPLPNLMEEMTLEEWKTLADKYHPSSMTQKEYDQFLDDLCEMGALNPEDLADLGHSQHQPAFVKVTAETCRAYVANGAEIPYLGSVPTFDRGAQRVNLFLWAQEEKAWSYYDEEQGGWMKSHKAQAFQQIYDILEGMQRYGIGR